MVQTRFLRCLLLTAVAVAAVLLSLAAVAPSWAGPVVDRGPLFNSYVERDVKRSSLIGAKYSSLELVLKGNLNIQVDLTADAGSQGPTGWDNWSVDYDTHFADVDERSVANKAPDYARLREEEIRRGTTRVIVGLSYALDPTAPATKEALEKESSEIAVAQKRLEEKLEGFNVRGASRGSSSFPT